MANDADAVDVAKQEQAISRVREHGFTLLTKTCERKGKIILVIFVFNDRFP